MISEREEIEQVLRVGKQILLERPALLEMSLQEVITELDDGSQEMIHNRWGVAAWLVVKSIRSFELSNLVNQLSEIESGILTYEYTGYLLQKEYQINMEELILEAEQQGKFDKIVSYVSENLIFESEIHEDCLLRMLGMLERQLANPFYYSLLRNYVQHICKMGAQNLAAEKLGTVDSHAKYDFVSNMRWEWYQQNVEEADNALGKMLVEKSIWSKKTAVDFLEVSLNYGTATFYQYLQEIKRLFLESEELQSQIVGVFVKYVEGTETNKYEKLDYVYNEVINLIEKILESTWKVKYKFIDAIICRQEIPEILNKIFHRIITQSLDRNSDILERLDHYFYKQLNKGKWEVVIQNMYEIFVANQYLSKYQDFFNAMNSTCYKLSEHSVEVTQKALFFMISGGVDYLFFGLGLLVNIGDIQKLKNKMNENAGNVEKIDDKQMVRLMKGIFYYVADSKRICRTIFQLLNFLEGEGDLSIKFCMSEVYGNYPLTMYEIISQYEEQKNEIQNQLVQMVKNKHEEILKDQNLGCKIKDLQPSKEHQYIYYRAQMEQNRQINKMAQEKSIFSQFANHRTMKYGKRSGHIATGRKNEKFYQISPYMEHKYQVEVPVHYIKDPVEYALRKMDYLEEVKQDAISAKRLFTAVEGKG